MTTSDDDSVAASMLHTATRSCRESAAHRPSVLLFPYRTLLVVSSVVVMVAVFSGYVIEFVLLAATVEWDALLDDLAALVLVVAVA